MSGQSALPDACESLALGNILAGISDFSVNSELTHCECYRWFRVIFRGGSNVFEKRGNLE
jgi:hypothetical protein